MGIALYIPCYNAERHIADVLKAALSQTLKLNEIIVVDDGSTDKTTEIVSAFPVRLIRHGQNRGLAAARNTAIKNSQEELIASLDSDCVPDPDWLERLVRKLNLNAKTVGAGGRLVEKHSSNVFDLWRSEHMKQCWNIEREPDFLFGSNTVFQRTVLLGIGLYNEDLRNNYEDVDLCARLRANKFHFIYEPEAVASHLKRDSIFSLLNSYWRWNLPYYKQKKFYDSLDNFSLKLRDNLGLANRYLMEDYEAGRVQLLYLDFLLSLHHCLKDLEFYLFRNTYDHHQPSRLNAWLTLIDLTFFYQFDHEKESLTSLLLKKDMLLLNLIALNLVLGRMIMDAFRNEDFQKKFYRHLFLSLRPGVESNLLLEGIEVFIKKHPAWGDFCTKKHPGLNSAFLGELSLAFKQWLDALVSSYPKIINQIENAAHSTVE